MIAKKIYLMLVFLQMDSEGATETDIAVPELSDVAEPCEVAAASDRG